MDPWSMQMPILRSLSSAVDCDIIRNLMDLVETVLPGLLSGKETFSRLLATLFVNHMAHGMEDFSEPWTVQSEWTFSVGPLRGRASVCLRNEVPKRGAAAACADVGSALSRSPSRRCMEAVGLYWTSGKKEEPYVTITRKTVLRKGSEVELEQEVGHSVCRLVTHRNASKRMAVIQAFLGSTPQLTLQLYVTVVEQNIPTNRGKCRSGLAGSGFTGRHFGGGDDDN
ncbi:hypothetical protein lerEdw1_014050 [Lerista edwardsae]|nr:hypothetical protein lerEdw1_014050 [Lerista edwardsae]